MQLNSSPHSNRKIIFTIVILLIVVVAGSLWFFVLSKKEIRVTGGKIFVPQEAAEKADEFSEFPEEVRPLLRNSLDEALGDIEALQL